METVLKIVIGILGVVAVWQAIRVFEISAKIKGSDTDQDVNDKDNKTQGFLLALFVVGLIGSFFWMVSAYAPMELPKSASVHGEDIDNLWDISMGLIIIVFLITQPLLFGFGYWFRGKKGRKAVFLEHDNKLEFIWTVVPALVLAVLIIYGLTTWSEVMNPSKDGEEPMVVEIYSKQFGWTARYAGADNTLGYANVQKIEGANVLGVDSTDKFSADDVVVTELHLPVGKPVLLKFRSQDVIHSAYLPHFRVQMNCVPGTPTHFQFVPSVTTADMRLDEHVITKTNNINEIRKAKGDDPYEFDYLLLCNKICGSAHYNMQLKVVVETQEEYDNWMKDQRAFATLTK